MYVLIDAMHYQSPFRAPFSTISSEELHCDRICNYFPVKSENFLDQGLGSHLKPLATRPRFRDGKKLPPTTLRLKFNRQHQLGVCLISSLMIAGNQCGRRLTFFRRHQTGRFLYRGGEFVNHGKESYRPPRCAISGDENFSLFAVLRQFWESITSCPREPPERGDWQDRLNHNQEAPRVIVLVSDYVNLARAFEPFGRD